MRQLQRDSKAEDVDKYRGGEDEVEQEAGVGVGGKGCLDIGEVEGGEDDGEIEDGCAGVCEAREGCGS